MKNIKKMKKCFIIAAAIFCCVTKIMAEPVPPVLINNYFKLDTSYVQTTHVFTTDYSKKAVKSSETLRAGLQNMIFMLSGKRKDLYPPEIFYDTLTAMSTFSDCYGHEICRLNESKQICHLVNSFFKYGTMILNSNPNIAFSLERGGKYVYRTILDFIGIDKADTMTVYDDPSLRVNGIFTVKTGQDFNISGFYNTGYPYDINSLTGEEYADVTIYKMETESTGREAFKHRFSLHLKDETHPLLAGWDSLLVNIIKPEIGSYIMRFETNWDAVATRDIPLSVEDTLRANVALDKEVYDLASEKKARMTLTMDYRYPHIQPTKSDPVPTIYVAATLLKDKEATDFLMTDTLKLVSDTMAIKNLNYIGEWNLDLSKIDASKLTEGYSTYQLKVNIIFNNEKQYEKFLPVDLKTIATGISHVTAPRIDNEPVFTLDGIRVDTSKPLPQGIYIQKGKKIRIN